jgi:hypothetical protein
MQRESTEGGTAKCARDISGIAAGEGIVQKAGSSCMIISSRISP